jgi:CubicO group peptidase (beta-lactamase class C family)
MGDLPAGTSPLSYHWMGGIGWGGQYLFVFPKLDLAVAMNCGIYHRPSTEQIAVARIILTDVVLPSLE